MTLITTRDCMGVVAGRVHVFKFCTRIVVSSNRERFTVWWETGNIPILYQIQYNYSIKLGMASRRMGHWVNV